MELKAAHEGYEYQDLLTSFFILKEILNENDSTFKIDTKEYPEDKIDDLTITNPFGVFKKQIKYSNEITNQQLQKKFLSSETSYQLHLDSLFESWNNHPDKYNCEIRICLAWQKPVDELIHILKPHSASFSFSSHTTQLYQIDIEKLWPNGKEPLSNWQRFKQKSKKINRMDFETFCNHLIIETNFPKQSPNTTFTGELEKIILDQINKLGIGEFPNDRITPKTFALELMQLIRRSRSRGFEIKTDQIFRELNVQTNFGSIEQVFPVVKEENIKTENAISGIKTILCHENRVLLTGEPGSGKSWFIQNLQNELQDNEYKIVKHYCYTELKDKHLEKRITLNVFYGNLINDILNVFPYLTEEKEQKYASNLNELNKLLQNIDKDTLLIIDGLDHIDRIFEFNRSDLNLNDVAIIKAIRQLQTSDKVKILVVSQPIEELRTFSEYKEIKIPNWAKTEIVAYFSKNSIVDTLITDYKLLSDILLEKSNGNPLYINYLCKEICKLDAITLDIIDTLPPYSYNLTNYYEYLISKLNTKESIPRILSGVTFSLSKTELSEITGEGEYVQEILETLSPILKQNFSNNGYIIYHESFRRFIIEQLKKKNVSIYQNIFKPLIEWFEKKDFYSFPKAFRFYFPLLYENQKYDKILDCLNNEFVTKSICYGHSFEALKNNYHYFAKSALKQQNFPKIVLANEINKVLISTEDAYQEGFILYFSALGYLKGFKTIADYLVFEGKPALPLLSGLKACYLCNQHHEPAPWELYFEYFNENHEITVPDFKYYIRGLLVFKDTEALINVAEKTISKHTKYIKLYANELLEYHNRDYINELKSNSPVFDEMLICLHKKTVETDLDLLILSKKLLERDSIFEEDLPLLNSFFAQIEYNIENIDLINQIILLFEAKNWFYNWIIYYIKIKVLQSKTSVSYFEVKEAFQYLVNDTEPFKGHPRTCDLYSVRDLVYNSFVSGLKFIKNYKEWNEIIELLIKLSNDTTTTIQKSLGGPLATDKLFQILDETANDVNRKKIIESFENLTLEKQDFHLHSYITEYYFRLSKQYSIIGEKEKAEEKYNIGIKFFLGYTFWKDIFLKDVINSIESFSKIDNTLGNGSIKNLKSIVDSVTSHTSGKGTKHFPIEWYQKFLNINFDDALKYLLTQLIETTYYWVYEGQLQDLLIKANGEINPLIELFIYRTFPIETSEKFLNYGLTLVEKNKSIEYDLSKQFLASLIDKSENKREQTFGKPYLTKLKELVTIFGFDWNTNLSEKKEYRNEISAIELIKANSVPRKELLDMTAQEQTEYFSKNKIKKTDLISLYYYFNSLHTLTSDIQGLIKSIVEKHEEYPKNNNIDLANVFDQKNDIAVYYWVCQFVTQRDGWYNCLINIEAFKKAYLINPELAIRLFVNLSDKFLELGFSPSFSSNFLNALVEIDYHPDIIKEMWNTLYCAAEIRLPIKEKIKWKELLSDDCNMSIEEKFICLLFTRFKSNTTERHHWTLSGIVYLYQFYPEKMIKPTKWFLHNYKKFLKVNLLMILEILYDISKNNLEYHKNFENELNNLYPSNYYLIDYIIENLLTKNKTQLISISNLLYTAPQEEVDFFKSINYRNEILCNENFNFETIVGKFKTFFKEEYGEQIEFLQNRSLRQFVNNIYMANHQLELINQELYYELNEYYNRLYLYNFLHVDYKTIIAQTNSYIRRPLEICKPSSIKSNWKKREVVITDWIRLAYYEHELYEESYDNNKEYEVFEGIALKNNIEKTIPFSRCRLFPMQIWENRTRKERDEFLCLFLIQRYDMLENYKILWLNSNIINELDLEISNPVNGLFAQNKKNEVVIKYNCWASDYVWVDDRSTISDEIPRIEGAELICRKDYFEKIINLYQPEKPYLYQLKR